MIRIESKENEIYQSVKKLKDKKYRSQEDKFLVEGFRFVLEALESDFNVPLVLISSEQEERYNKYNIYEKLQQDTKVYVLPDMLFKTLCHTDTPQGIIAVVLKKEFVFLDKEGFYILVDGVQDPGNLGTIIRTADAAGALGVILLKGTVDVYNDKTLRSTMGSIFHMPIFEIGHIDKLKELLGLGFKLIVTSLQGENNFYDENITGKVIIALGNEGNGISEETDRLSDIKVKIPMLGRAESLNVAIAGAIIMYEYIRCQALYADKL